MAYMATPSLVLSFGEGSLEVSAFSNMNEMQASAEAKFNLYPDSYDFFDSFGKVEAAALQRVVRMVGDGVPCSLEIRERPEWQKIRHLEERIEAVAASRPGAASAAPAPAPQLLLLASPPSAAEGAGEGLEERIEAVVASRPGAASAAPAPQLLLLSSPPSAAAEGLEGEMEELRSSLAQVESKVSGALAPLMQSMALNQIDLQAKLDSIDELGMKSRLDALEDRIAAAKKEELPTSTGKAPSAAATPQQLPACKLDLFAADDSPASSFASPSFGAGSLRAGHEAFSGGKAGHSAFADQLWRSPLSGASSPLAFGAEQLPGLVAKGPRFLKSVAAGGSMGDWGDKGSGLRRAERKLASSRSSPILPPVF